MPENIGNQALRMAANFSRIRNNEAIRENVALRNKTTVDAKQKEALTQVWADELVKNPEAKMPDELPHGVKFASKVLALKHKTNFAILDRQNFARDAETYTQDMDTALASFGSEDRAYYKEPVLKALSRIRDGNSNWKEISPPKDGVKARWSYTNNSDGKTYEIDEPDKEFIHKYLSAHRDIKPYLTAKAAETTHMRDYNEKLMLKGGKDYFGKDGSKATVYPQKMLNNGGYEDLIVATSVDGVERELKTPEEKKWFNENFESVEDEEAKTKIAEAKREREVTGIDRPIKANGRTYKTRSEAHRDLSLMIKVLYNNKPDKMDKALGIIAAMAAGKKPSEGKEVASIYAQIKEAQETGSAEERTNATKTLNLLSAITGLGESGGLNISGDKNWRDYR